MPRICDIGSEVFSTCFVASIAKRISSCFAAIVVGNHITATLNGQRVHNNAVLPAMTGGALDNDELAPGPIMIQGDHSRVSFRKLVVTPIVKPGM